MKRVTLASAMGLSALFVTLSLAGLFGSVGEAFDAILTGLLGVAAWGVVLMLGYSSAVIACGKSFSAFRAFGDLVIIVVASAFAHLISSEAGGVVGEAVGDAGVSAFSLAGTFIMGLFLVGLIVAERIKMLSLLSRFAEAILSATSEPSFPYEAYSEPLAKPIRSDALYEHRLVFPRGRDMMVAGHKSSDALYEHRPETRECTAFVTDDTMPVVEEQPKSAPVASVVRAARASSVVVKFALPSSKLLAKGEAGAGSNDAELQEEAELLVSTIGAYDVEVKVEEIVVGPTVTTFECAVARGTKLSKVMGLADDLSLAFGRKVRVVASRMGRVGFEVAREKRAVVGLRELIEDASFQSMKGLPVVVGRGVRGEAVFLDLSDAPHLIIAGSTGSGKSVGINTLLLSLLYRRTPDELKLILIDPKCVELLPFANLPHLLCPPITDAAESQTALAWCVAEMERRYQLLAKSGSKNIATFNAKVSSGERLPFIVVVVDEAGDLMMQGGKEIESMLVRLGQKARASGIHVVLSTQRPSVDILTGLIKSNFPARIAYRTAQSVDSRIILDEVGAERLLGRGDALVRVGGDSLVRAQGPYVSEEEIAAVVSHWCNQSMPRYDSSVLAGPDSEELEVKQPKASRKDAAVKVWS